MQHELERGDIRDDRRPRIEKPFAGSNGPAFEDQALRCRRDVSHWDADKASASRVPIPSNMLHGKTYIQATEVSSKAITLLHCSPFGTVDLFQYRVAVAQGACSAHQSLLFDLTKVSIRNRQRGFKKERRVLICRRCAHAPRSLV